MKYESTKFVCEDSECKDPERHSHTDGYWVNTVKLLRLKLADLKTDLRLQKEAGRQQWELTQETKAQVAALREALHMITDDPGYWERVEELARKALAFPTTPSIGETK